MFVHIVQNKPPLNDRALSLFLVFLQSGLVAGLGEKLAAEMRQRIMVLDGAMGTMIQKYKLSEEQFRGRRVVRGHL